MANTFPLNLHINDSHSLLGPRRPLKFIFIPKAIFLLKNYHLLFFFREKINQMQSYPDGLYVS